jgi:hypothetical protein
MLMTAAHLRKIVVGEEGIEPPTFGKCCADALPLSYSPDPNVRTTGGGEPKTIVNSAAFSRTEIRWDEASNTHRVAFPSSKHLASPLLNGSHLTLALESPQHQCPVPEACEDGFIQLR